MKCTVYRSPRKAGTYLYVAEAEELEQLPEELLATFGAPEAFLELELHADRPLAQADVAEVIANLQQQGYHLQLPPGDPQARLES